MGVIHIWTLYDTDNPRGSVVWMTILRNFSFGKSLFGLGGELRTHTKCLSSSAFGPLGEGISLDSLSVSLLESITSCRSQQSIADCCDSQVEPFKMLERFMASRVKKNGRESILAVSVTVTVRL